MTHSFAPSGNTHLGFNMCLICHEAEHLHQPANDKGGSARELWDEIADITVYTDGTPYSNEPTELGTLLKQYDALHVLDEIVKIAAESTRRELLALEGRITQLQTYKMFDSADAEKLVELKDVKAELRKRLSELEGGKL